MELFVVLLIIAIIAALAVPNYLKRVERTRGERAIANAQIIAQALRMYYVKYNQYISATPLHPYPDGLDIINTNLDLDIEDPYFNYYIFAGEVAPDGDPLQGMTIERNSGIYQERHLRYLIDIDGDPEGWDSSSSWPWTPPGDEYD